MFKRVFQIPVPPQCVERPAQAERFIQRHDVGFQFSCPDAVLGVHKLKLISISGIWEAQGLLRLAVAENMERIGLVKGRDAKIALAAINPGIGV